MRNSGRSGGAAGMVAGLKEIIRNIKGAVKRRRDREKGIFIHESHSSAQLPGELRINLGSALGCATLLIVIVIINILIFILFSVQ